MPEAVTTRTRDALTHAWSAERLEAIRIAALPALRAAASARSGGNRAVAPGRKEPLAPLRGERVGVMGRGAAGRSPYAARISSPQTACKRSRPTLSLPLFTVDGEAHGLRALAPPGALRRVMEHQDRAVARGDRFRWRCDRVRYRERESGVGVIPCGKRRQVGRVGGRRRSGFAPDMTDHQEIWVNQARWRDSWVAVRKLPGGGQGNAWRVRRKRDDRDGFLKAIKAKRVPERRARFSREANAYGTRLTFRGDAPLWQNAGHDMVQGQRRRLHLRPVGQSRAAPPRIRRPLRGFSRFGNLAVLAKIQNELRQPTPIC